MAGIYAVKSECDLTRSFLDRAMALWPDVSDAFYFTGAGQNRIRNR